MPAFFKQALAEKTNRAAAEQAILQSQPSASALNIQAAFDFARRMQRQQFDPPREVVAPTLEIQEGQLGIRPRPDARRYAFFRCLRQFSVQ